MAIICAKRYVTTSLYFSVAKTNSPKNALADDPAAGLKDSVASDGPKFSEQHLLLMLSPN